MNNHDENGWADLVYVCIVMAIFVMVKYIEAVVRAWMLNPYYKPLWLATGFAIVMTIIAYMIDFREPIINSLYSLSHLILFVLAKAMDVYYDNYIQKEMTQESVIDQVRHGPWWAPDPQQKPN